MIFLFLSSETADLVDDWRAHSPPLEIWWVTEVDPHIPRGPHLGSQEKKLASHVASAPTARGEGAGRPATVAAAVASMSVTIIEELLCGAAGGVLGTACSHPLDTLKTRMQAGIRFEVWPARVSKSKPPTQSSARPSEAPADKPSAPPPAASLRFASCLADAPLC